MSGPSAAELELQYTQHVLACLVYEIQVNYVETEDRDEDPPFDILERLATLIAYAPPAVMPLVEYLKRTLPPGGQGESYTYSFPFIEWRCE